MFFLLLPVEDALHAGHGFPSVVLSRKSILRFCGLRHAALAVGTRMSATVDGLLQFCPAILSHCET